MAFVCSFCVSQLFTHCISIIWTEIIITHSAPLSIAVHLYQTLISVVTPSESYHTIVWVAPETRGHFKSNSKNVTNILNIATVLYQLTAGDWGIITSIDTTWRNVCAEVTLQNHQVLTGGAVQIIQSDGGVVCPKPALWTYMEHCCRSLSD